MPRSLKVVFLDARLTRDVIQTSFCAISASLSFPEASIRQVVKSETRTHVRKQFGTNGVGGHRERETTMTFKLPPQVRTVFVPFRVVV